jgi:hypothetical protein
VRCRFKADRTNVSGHKPESFPEIKNCDSTEIFFGTYIQLKSRNNSVGIALSYGMDDRGFGVRFPTGAGNVSLHHRVQNGSETHPAPIQRVPGALSLGVKRPGRETDHSPPSSAEIKK